MRVRNLPFAVFVGMVILQISQGNLTSLDEVIAVAADARATAESTAGFETEGWVKGYGGCCCSQDGQKGSRVELHCGSVYC